MVFNRVFDGRDAVRDRGILLLRGGHTRQDLRDDGLRILRAGVIRGDDGKIGQFRSDAPHLRALPPVPVAAAAEEGHNPPRRGLPHAAKHVFQSIRRMGVVDQDRVVPVRRNSLDSALHTLRRRQRRRGLRQRDAQQSGAGQHAQRVVHGEAPRDVEAHLGALSLRFRAELHAVGQKPGVTCAKICILEAVGQRRAGDISQEIRRPGVVPVHRGGGAHGKQLCLGLRVGLHGLVVVQMVLRQVRKRPDGKMDARHPVLVQRVGGHLHHHMAAPGVRHLAEQLLKLIALGRRALRGDGPVSDPIAVGTDKPYLRATGPLQHMLEQECRGRLAVGTGEAHDGHLF